MSSHTAASSSSSAPITLQGALLKAYEDFVAGKGSLSQQQIDELKKVTHLPDEFINGDEDERFKNITAIDLSMFVSVVKIGHSFLFNCSALTSADLSALTSLSIIGGSFLCECSAMTSLTLPSASKITKIEGWFLGNCSSLTAINNMQALSNVTEIGQAFLYKCPKLTKKEPLDQVDLSPLLHLSDNDIEVHSNESKTNNLKVALARVRAGGANGPKLAASSSSTSSPTAASQSSSTSACQNCKKLEDKLECKDMQIAKLEQEKEGEKQQHQQLLNKQAERLREFSDQKQKLEADLTSLKDENTRHLEKLRDQANLLQDLKQAKESSSGVAPAPEENQQQAEIRKMKVAELCALLEEHAVAPKILSILKDEGVAGREFLHQKFLEENEDLFGSVRKTAFETFKELHAELSAAAGTGKGTSSTTTSATAASH